MKKTNNSDVIIHLLYFSIPLLFLFTPAVFANDAPHNEGSGVDCGECHGQVLFNSDPDDPGTTAESRFCMYENVCLRCHKSTDPPYHNINAPMVKGHHNPSYEGNAEGGKCDSDDPVVGWSDMPKCIDCHHPHYQTWQTSYGIWDELYGDGHSNAYEVAVGQGPGTVDDYTLETIGESQFFRVRIDYTGLTMKPGWEPEDLEAKTSGGRGMLFMPYRSQPYYGTMIESIEDNGDGNGSIYLKVMPDPYTPAQPYLYYVGEFAVSYGQAVNRVIPFLIDADNDGGRDDAITESVLFFDHDSTSDGSLTDDTYSFAHNDELVDVDPPDGDPDGILDDSTPNGICQVCHTETRHWRRDGTKANDHYSGWNCTNKCHKHTNGFFHSSGAGELCVECHGHDVGTVYGASPTWPYDPNDDELESIGAGSSWSHSTHTENDADDQMGPTRYDPAAEENVQIYCDTCHDLDNMPLFKNLDDTGSHTFEETDICNNCHSPEGSYDGVNDPVAGAKTNWHSGIYNSDRTLQEGKERWCVTCHDEEPSNSRDDGTGVEAPNIAGGESEDYTYGNGWGFYKTGHGVPSSEILPSSGGITNGPGKGCGDCHDLTTKHIDGNARTFEYSSGDGSALYQTGYRLIGIGGDYPMHIPPDGTNSYRLCFSCHTNTDQWIGSVNDRNGTNFWSGSRNDHYYHMRSISSTSSGINPDYDWNGSYEKGNPTCITCHNVHGSTNPAMVRDGSLNGKSGFVTRYGNSCDTDYASSEITLAESTVLASQKSSFQGQYCSNTCHGNNTGFIAISRTPATVASRVPQLDWVGGPTYEYDGANPDAASSGTEFTFKVEYSDMNQDQPDWVRLWIDRDGDGLYEDPPNPPTNPPEIIDMVQAFAGLNACAEYSKGVDYVTYVTLDKSDLASGNVVKYTFRAEDQNNHDSAVGPATGDSSLIILNDAPTLFWTEESNYENDGVNPDYGPANGTYSFRVKYVDEDGDTCPASSSSNIQVWIDLDQSSTYDGGEKFNLSEVSGTDTDCTSDGDGKRYFTNPGLILPNASGSTIIYDYRFYAFDGTNEASGAPADSGGTVTVVATGNNPPFLAWATDTCRPEGARPPRSALSSTIVFTVGYFDEDNECPAGGGIDGNGRNIQVYVDLNGDNDYEDTGEVIDMDVDPSDSDPDCTTADGGKLYSIEVTPTTVAEDIEYEFHATDGTDEALGEPRSNGGTVDVIDADHVVRQDGNGDFTTISAALSGGVSGDVILAYDGTYDEYLSWSQWQWRFFYSACGAEETIISNTHDPVVFFNHSGASVIDGFTVTGSSGRGIFSDGTNFDGTQSRPTIKDCIIRNNIGRGIEGAESNVTITGCEIHNNGGGVLSYNTTITDTIIHDNAVTGNGGGIASRNPGGAFSLTNVVIKDNTASGNGGGIYCYNSGYSAYAPSYEKVTLSGNQSTGGSGGGGYFTWCSPSFTNSLISDNRAPDGGGLRFGSSPSNAWINNSAIVNNTASPGDGGAFYHSGTGSSIHFANSILWFNRADGGGHIGRFTQATGSVVSANLYDSLVENNGDSDITDDDYFKLTNANYVNVVDTGTNYDTDPNFVNPHANGDYHINQPSDAIDNAGNSSGWGIPSDDLEGKSRPTGSEDIGAYELEGSNTALAWTGEEGYSEDGVEPAYGTVATTFIFRVDYINDDNVQPATMQLWIDENDDDAYSEDEKYDLVEVDTGDTTYTDGKRYTKFLNISYFGDGTINYRFYATDGSAEAAGAPTEDNSILLLNTAPSLSWTGETNYTDDGSHPDSGAGGSIFTFRVKYTDADDAVPSAIQVWVDTDNSGAYDPHEKFDMTQDDDDGDSLYTNGEKYAKSLTIPYVGDGAITYRFYASDGKYVAISAEPVSDTNLTITAPSGNSAPTLDWTAADCLDNGVRPPVGAGGADFEFKVIYTDADAGQCADDILVLIDADDDGTYEPGEKYILTGDIGDTDCTDGRLYAATLTVEAAGDSILNYSFYATDGYEAATGTPTFDSTVTVLDGVSVRPDTSSLPYDYTSIITAANAAETVVVYPEDDFTTATYTENVSLNNMDGRTIRSACGADYTIVSSSSTGSTVVVQDCGNFVMDGFSLTGATNSGASASGFYVNRVDGTTTKLSNCKVYGNYYGLFINDSSSVPVEIDNVEIYSNTGRGILVNNDVAPVNISNSEIYSHNTSLAGAAIFINEAGTHTISKTVIRDNVTTGEGGAFYINGAGNVSIENSIIADNQGSNGGAIRTNNGPILSVINSTFANNTATGYGGVFYICAVGSTTVRNSIFWENSAATDGSVAYKACGNLDDFITVSHSNVTTSGNNFGGGIPDTTGGGNIDPAQDPLFVDDDDPAPYDYHIESGSPVIDQASAAYAPEDDIDSEDRPQGVADDMGADEYVPPIPVYSTTIGTTTAEAVSTSSIAISMYYTDDDDHDNTYAVKYKLSSSGTWLDWQTNPKNHSDSPYTDTIGGLTPGETYDVQLTYFDDPDGVNGDNPQEFLNITLPNQTVSGTVYTDEGITAIGNGTTVRLIADGVSMGTDTTESGAYSITAGISAGDAILVYIDGAGTDGTTVTVSDGSSSLSGINIYGDHLIVQNDNSGSMTNTLMNTALGSYSDAEILYTVTGGIMTTTDNTELYIPAAFTYTPGNTVTAGSVDINGTFDAEANAINVSGSWDATGGVFTSSGTVTFDAASGTVTITPGGTDEEHDFGYIEFNDNGGSATFQLAGALDVNSILLITDGIFDTSTSDFSVNVGGAFTQLGGSIIGNGSTISVGGNFYVTGSTGFEDATLELTGSSQKMYGSTTFNNLSKTVSAADSLTFEAGQTITIDGTVTLKGVSGGILSLVSTSPGTAWNFTVNADAIKDIDYVYVSWSDASGSDASQKPIDPTNSTGDGNNVDWFSEPPVTPVNSSPANGTTGVSKTPALSASTFDDPDLPNDSHQASQWLVDDNSDCGTPVYDSGAVGDLTSHTVSLTLNSYATYYWCVSYQDSYGAWSDYSSSTSFTTLNNAPNQPTNSLPSNDATGVSTTPTLAASGFSDPDTDDSHTASQWQVDDNADFSSITYDSGEVGDLVSHDVGAALANDTTYYWQVRYKDNHGSWSSYSTSTSFKTEKAGGSSTYFICDTESAPYDKIQTAIADAATVDGDTLEVCAGTWSEHIDFLSKNITVKAISSNRSATIIQGTPGNDAPVVKFNNAALASSAKLEGFTIDNQGSNCNSRGIYIGSGAAPTITKTDIVGNNAGCNYYGAGVYITGSGATIDDVSIGVAGKPNTTGGGGAGLFATGSSSAALTIANSIISYNTATLSGAGVHLASRNTLTTISGTTISNNSAGDYGGGIYSSSSQVSIESGSLISGNSSSDTGMQGGGVFITAATTQPSSITNSIVSGNHAYGGGGIGVTGGADLTVTSSIVEGNWTNTNQTNSGGGIYASGTGTTVDIHKSIVRGNEAVQYGGGFFLTSSAAVTLTNTIVSGNTADGTTYSDGGGIYNSAILTLMNTTVAGNYAYRYGGGLNGGGTITNSIFWANTSGNTGPQINGNPTLAFTTIEGGGFSGVNVISDDPVFVSTAQASNGSPTVMGDFRIKSTSNVINVGTKTGAPDDDIDGDDRTGETFYDMGADEYIAGNPPSTPFNDTPEDGETGVDRNPTLIASAFVDADGDSHSASQWQIGTGSDFDALIYDSGATTDLESHEAWITLDTGSTYYWRVRYQDNTGEWSGYPEGTSFTVTTIDLPDGAVSYWKFDEGSGTAYDSMGSNDGTLSGAAWTTGGIYDDAVSYDGSSDTVDTGAGSASSLGLTGDMTIEAWVSSTNDYAGRTLISKGYSDEFDLTFFSGMLNYYSDRPSNPYYWQATFNTPFTADGTWYHVVFIRDESDRSAYLYVNGVQDAITGNYWSDPSESANNVYIGSRSGAANSFSGIIDEVVVYDRILKGSEIQDRYNAAGDGVTFSAPVQPSNTTPNNGDTEVSVTPTLTATSFLDGDGHSHASSRWQLRKDGGIYGDTDSFDTGNTTVDLVSTSLTTGTAWDAPSWKYRRAVSLSGATPIADYVLTINLTPDNFDYGKANGDGSDLRFYDDGGTLLGHNIRIWNSNGYSTVVVEIPASGTSTIYMYYGNDGASDASNTSIVSTTLIDPGFTNADDFTGIWEQKATGVSGSAPNWTASIQGGDVDSHYVDFTGDPGSYAGHMYIAQEFQIPAGLTDASFSLDYLTYCAQGTRSGAVSLMVLEKNVWEKFATDYLNYDYRNIPAVWGEEDLHVATEGDANGAWVTESSTTDLATPLSAYAGQNLMAVAVWTGWHTADVEWGRFDNFSFTYTSSTTSELTAELRSEQKYPGSTLTADTKYYWRVQYKDETGDWSRWSDETSFTTAP